MDEHQVLLNTFVARIKEASALSRGDRVQVENYGSTVFDLTSGCHGHFAAAAAGESLALKVIEQVVQFATQDLVIDVLLGERIVPGYAEKRFRSRLGEILDRELVPVLADVPDEIKQMICDEIVVIALDCCRGKESNTALLWEIAQKEQRTSRIHDILATHASWVGRLLTEIVKSVGR